MNTEAAKNFINLFQEKVRQLDGMVTRAAISFADDPTKPELKATYERHKCALQYMSEMYNKASDAVYDIEREATKLATAPQTEN